MRSDLGPGTLVAGRYRLERLLGAGGMAAVWGGRDGRLDRMVAIKIMADTLAGDGDYVARFEREARIAASLSHPNLVQVFDYASDPRPLLVMEYVGGGSLADRERDGRSLPSAGRLARDLLAALAGIHEAGIVHRDVKPGNVLLGADGRALLTDFGIAQPADATRLTATGQVIGTLRYLAPEVARGERATARSDLYALGVLLREHGAAAEPEIDALTGRLTAAEPSERPGSARAALDELATGVPMAATRRLTARTAMASGPTRRVTSWSIGRRGRALWPALALLVVIALLIVGATGGGDGERGVPRPAPPDAPVERQLDALERGVRQLGGR